MRLPAPSPIIRPSPERHRSPPFSQTSPAPSLPLPLSRFTGVGSTFHTSAADAAEFVRERFHDFPFWPQLKGESMLDQALAPPSATTLPGFYELLKRLDASGSPWVKGQVAGPRCLAEAGKGNFATLATKVSTHARWQAAQIRMAGKQAVIAVDEPSWTGPLEAVDRDAAARMVAEIRAAGAVVGFHCCGKGAWADVLALKPDFVNPDVSGGVKAWVAEFEKPLAAHVAGGGWIGWGIVPTDRAVPLGHSRAILKEFLAAIAPLGDKKKVLEHSFFTPACGLAGLTPQQAEDVLRALYEMSRFCRLDHLGLKAG